MKSSGTAQTLDAGATGTENFLKPSFWNAVPHFSQIAVFPLMWLAAYYGGWWIVGPVVFFVIVDFFEPFFGHDSNNMDPKNTPENKLFLYSLASWLWGFLWPITFIFVLWQLLVSSHLNLIEVIFIVALTIGVAQSIFIAGHEMIHRQAAWERWLGEFLLASASYPQYATEHVYLHHRFACTPYDCSFAPKGRSFWQCFPKDLRDSLIGAWRSERERLKRRRRPVWHYSNPFWRYFFETGFWWVLIYVLGGVWTLLLYFVICFTVVLSMKSINYAQHYGLQRVRLPNGRFERVKPRHSWSANYKFSKWVYYNMQRHADHHIAAYRRYPLLQYYGAEESPQLPGTYMQIGSKVMKPKQWFKLMDPLVDEWRAKFYPEIDDWTVYDSKAFSSRPEAFEVITEIYNVSPNLYRWIEQFPELLDTLDQKEFKDIDLPSGFVQDSDFESIARSGLARVYWTHEFNVNEMQAQIAEIPAQTIQEVVENARNWTNEKIVQVCVHMIRGNLSPVEAGTAMSRVGEAAINSILRKVSENFSEKFGLLNDGGIAAVVSGELASESDTTLGTQLDIYFVYSSGNDQYCESMCRQFLKEIQSYLRSNILFAPDLAEDRQNSICTLVSLSDQHNLESSDNIRKLIKSRRIFTYGKSDFGNRFDRTRQEILGNQDASLDMIASTPAKELPPQVNSELTITESIERGIEEVEKAAAILQLRHTRHSPEILHPNAISVFELAAENKSISRELSEQLIDEATTWRNLAGILKLVATDNFAVETANPNVKSMIARSCGLENPDEMNATIADLALSSSTAVDRLKIADS